MGEKTGMRTRTDATRRAVLSGLRSLPATAKLADVIPVINALVLALTPTTTATGPMPDAISTAVETARSRVRDRASAIVKQKTPA